jgi:peptidoglycan/xylan/chitin deacetylase (PgdA/CDA1 family)
MLKKCIAGLAALMVSLLPLNGLAHGEAVTPTNLITNPSIESTADGVNPDGWLFSNWGTNTSVGTYLTTGHTGNHSLKVETTAYTDGATNWYYADVPVTAGQTYEYSNWYQSTVDTEVDAQVMINGVAQYFYLGTVLANSNWTQFKTTFTVPAGATSMAIYQILAKAGSITTDDYSLTTYTATPFTSPIVSVTFDDGWKNQITNAVPVMQANGLIGTYYIISDASVTHPDAQYMNANDIQALYAQGNEIASHTVHHCDLTGKQTDDATNCPLNISAAQVNSEMQDSQTVLQNLLGVPVTDFAYPYGAYDANSIATGQKYYTSQRTVNAGFNTKDNFNVTQLKMYEVDSNITTAAQMAYLKSKQTAGLTSVKTVAQALADIQAQMGSTIPPVVKPGDINGDGAVNNDDATLLFANWGIVPGGATNTPSDLDHNGVINNDDATLLFANWSK